MAKKTQAVYDLVHEVLESLPRPYGEDITEDVFVRIEQNPHWLLRYNALGVELNEDWVVNNWIGKYTKDITGKQIVRGVNSTRSNLTKGYSKLR